jgi:cell division transport system permease protein
MTLDLARWRPGPLLPRAAGRGFAPFAAMALIAFVASLAAAGGLIGAYVARDWLKPAPVGSITITVQARGLESADAAAARSAEILGGLAGVAKAEAFDGAPDPSASADGGARSVVVRFRSAGAPLDPARLAHALEAAGIAATLEDHDLFTSPARRPIVLMMAGSAAAVVLAMIVTAILVALNARRLLARVRDLMDLLRSAGATDSFIASLFRDRFAAAAAAGGLAGGMLAIAVCAVMRALSPSLAGPLTAAVAPRMILWASLAGAMPWPIILGLIGAAMARGAARSVLHKAP